MNLLRECRQFDRRCAYISTVAAIGVMEHLTNPMLFEAYLAHAIIALHDAWAFRCRAIVLRSALGGARTVSGRVLPRVHARPLEWLRNHWGRKAMSANWEPDWFIPATAIRAASILGVGNVNQITIGLGTLTSAEEVRITRNVVAHSLPATWKRLCNMERALGHTGRESPSEFAVSRYQRVGARYIEKWISELKICLHTAVG